MKPLTSRSSMDPVDENGLWPQGDPQDPQDSGELDDEEAQRDWEALLYSQIHHEQTEPTFSIRTATHTTTPIQPPATTSFTPEEVGVPNLGQMNEASSEEEDEDDDDGIMVLPRPVLVPVDIPLISLDSSEDEQELQVQGQRGPKSRSESEEDEDNVRKMPGTRASRSTQVVDLVSSSGLSSGDDQDCVEEEIVIQGQRIPAQTRTMGVPRRARLTINESTSEHSLTEDERTDTPPPHPQTQRKLELKKKSAEVLQAYKAVFASSDDSSGDERLSLGSGEVSLNLLAPPSKRSWLSAQNLDPLSAFKNCPPGEQPPIRIHKWTDGMYQFYNEISQTSFHDTLDDIMQQIPDNANWRVNRTDRMGVLGSGSSLYRRGKSRYFDRSRCGNCKQMGHLTRQCPDPPKPLICNMCAARGHLRQACPNASCLRCSQPSYDFTSNCFHCRKLNKTHCLECGAPGHAKQNCPDHWRRFHQTVEPGGVFQPRDHDRIHKSESEMSCPNCAREGHSLHKCRGFRPTANPFPVLKVVSYEEPPNLVAEEPLISSKKGLRKWLREEITAKIGGLILATLKIVIMSLNLVNDKGKMENYQEKWFLMISSTV
ncbi:hypothetical protein TCAL_16813 [Tigriopus californicus]|uniref:Zinc finger CCHC domain-containing protein 7 n=1 Tax=Tigriopus californicus TaxID=6832 RepID=A0A553PC06_TIGCA|nr:hypothetical protein TCAL_16813 [Tigriopus californicus]